MGLDISVNAKVSEVLESFESDQPELRRLFREACERVFLAQNECIRTRPGSYEGLHRVRAAYARLHGIDTASVIEWQDADVLPGSHLVQHSDCEGWYIPEAFDPPILTDDVSIGSSARLLAELREIDLGKLDDYERWAWDAVFVAAVASVVCWKPIEFH